MSDIVRWSPADGPPDRGEPDGTLDSDGKMRLQVGRREIPLAMHDHIAAEVLAQLDVGSVALPMVRTDKGDRMEL